MVMPTVTEVRPAHPDAGDQRLSALIARARTSGDVESYLEARERVQAERVFAEIGGAIERGLRTLDASAPDARLLERLRLALSARA